MLSWFRTPKKPQEKAQPIRKARLEVEELETRCVLSTATPEFPEVDTNAQSSVVQGDAPEIMSVSEIPSSPLNWEVGDMRPSFDWLGFSNGYHLRYRAAPGSTVSGNVHYYRSPILPTGPIYARTTWGWDIFDSPGVEIQYPDPTSSFYTDPIDPRNSFEIVWSSALNGLHVSENGSFTYTPSNSEAESASFAVNQPNRQWWWQITVTIVYDLPAAEVQDEAISPPTYPPVPNEPPLDILADDRDDGADLGDQTAEGNAMDEAFSDLATAFDVAAEQDSSDDSKETPTNPDSMQDSGAANGVFHDANANGNESNLGSPADDHDAHEIDTTPPVLKGWVEIDVPLDPFPHSPAPALAEAEPAPMPKTPASIIVAGPPASPDNVELPAPPAQIATGTRVVASSFGIGLIPLDAVAGMPVAGPLVEYPKSIFEVKLVEIGNHVAHPSRSFVMTHGWMGTLPGDRMQTLGKTIKELYPDTANVYYLDWSEGAYGALPFTVAANIRPAADAALRNLLSAHIAPDTLTLIGESYGTYVNALIAENWAAVSPPVHGGPGPVDRIIALNPANEKGGFPAQFEDWIQQLRFEDLLGPVVPPELRLLASLAEQMSEILVPQMAFAARDSLAIHTNSAADTSQSVANADYFLDAESFKVTQTADKHLMGPVWLTNELLTRNTEWLDFDSKTLKAANRTDSQYDGSIKYDEQSNTFRTDYRKPIDKEPTDTDGLGEAALLWREIQSRLLNTAPLFASRIEQLVDGRYTYEGKTVAFTEHRTPHYYVPYAQAVQMIGPAGIGESGLLTISSLDPSTPGVQPLRYKIVFEPASSNPVYSITITQALDPHLDITTFRMGDVVLGGDDTRKDAKDSTMGPLVLNDLNPGTPYDFEPRRFVYWGRDALISGHLDQASREVTWTIRSANPELSFFPDGQRHIGAWQGSVSYDVHAYRNLTPRTQLWAQASVVFDHRHAVSNAFLNTIDGLLLKGRVILVAANDERDTVPVHVLEAQRFACHAWSPTPSSAARAAHAASLHLDVSVPSLKTSSSQGSTGFLAVADADVMALSELSPGVGPTDGGKPQEAFDDDRSTGQPANAENGSQIELNEHGTVTAQPTMLRPEDRAIDIVFAQHAVAGTEAATGANDPRAPMVDEVDLKPLATLAVLFGRITEPVTTIQSRQPIKRRAH